MSYRKLKSSDRTFIKGETNRVIHQMYSNAAYLGTVQAYEAAKERMNQAYLAMELEDDPEKKLRLAKVVERYTAQAQSILDDWEVRNSRAEKEVRNIKLILWLTVLFALSFVFPVNIILVALFSIWFYRNYVGSSRPGQVKQVVPVHAEKTKEEQYEDWLTEKIVTLDKDKREWTETMLSKYDDLDDIVAGNGQIDEKDVKTSNALLKRYRDILADIEKLPDSDWKKYYLDFHQEMIAELEDVFEQLHIV